MGGYYGESYTVVEELSRNGYPPSSSNLPGSGVRAGSSAIVFLKKYVTFVSYITLVTCIMY